MVFLCIQQYYNFPDKEKKLYYNFIQKKINNKQTTHKKYYLNLFSLKQTLYSDLISNSLIYKPILSFFLSIDFAKRRALTFAKR